jgi:hypothetical protein
VTRKRIAKIGALVSVFLIGFALTEVALLANFGLAVSIFQLLIVGILTVTSSRFMFESRCSLRREVIYLDGMRAVDAALTEANYELAVGALMEWDQTIRHEVAMQEAHPWSPVTFWRFPPGYREDWD